MKRGRPRKITPYLNGKTYCARFKAHHGQQLNRSLKTSNLVNAEILCKELELLCINPKAQTSLEAQAIYFKDKKYKSERTSQDTFQELSKLQTEVKLLKEQIEILKPYKDKYEALIQDKEIRQLKNFKSLPNFKKVFDEYETAIQHLAGKGDDHLSLLKGLGDYCELWSKKIGQIETKTIYKFLDFYSTNKKVMTAGEFILKQASNPPERWNRARRKLHRFFKWLSVKYNIDNVVTRVETKKEKVKESIQWHSLEEVQEELKHHNEYWKAIIGMMCFAGLSAHEVRGLTKEDLTEKYISVHPTKDRQIKSGNRIRQVNIHKTHLAPLLKDYKPREDSKFLFPSSVAGSEMWLGDTFSVHFRKILKNKNINALSLRRTFGSLLIRSGKTTAEVAAAMGNTEIMVRKHYARLLGCEIDINF